MNTKQKGELSEIRIIAAMVEKGYTVSRPFGESCPYDIVVDDGISLKKVQIKTGRLREGAIVANATRQERSWKDKKAAGVKYVDIDAFAVFCPDTNTSYLIPFDEVSQTIITLRYEPTKNGQVYNVKLTKDYQIL